MYERSETMEAEGVRDAAASYVVAPVELMPDEMPSEYKRTEVGIIPRDWRVCLIGELGKVVRGASPRPAGDPRFFNGSYIPWLTVASITNLSSNCLYVKKTLTALSEKGAKHSRTLLPRTLIIANSGATLGVAKILEIRCCANDGIAALIEQHTGDKAFLCHYVNTQTSRLRDIVATGNGQPNLNTALIRNIRVPFPCIREQRAIATALSDVDALIESLDRLIVKKRAVKQGAMQQLLTGRKRLPGFELAWETTRLGDLGVFYKGRGIRRDDVSDEGVPCIRYGEIYTRYDNYVTEPESRIPSNIALSAFLLKTGDILFAGSGETAEEIGMCLAYLGETPAFAGGDIVILRPHCGISAYLGHLLNHPSIARQKARLGQGDAVVHISARNLSQIELRLPPEDEQTAIAAVLSDMDAEIEAMESRCDKARQIKQGMMQQLLTGRVRLVKPEAQP
ncbi:restriction endonuclease subunit S [Salinicola sp. V024]|uniref:restriction endonuclease subunit S n=1 Tax=Salinicola sp. V024 TaxID=3459609 RepID=UPI004043D1DE